MNYKIVALPITVPTGPFCSGPNGKCGFYENLDGTPKCILGLHLSNPTGILEYDEDYNVRKAVQCESLHDLPSTVKQESTPASGPSHGVGDDL